VVPKVWWRVVCRSKKGGREGRRERCKKKRFQSHTPKKKSHASAQKKKVSFMHSLSAYHPLLHIVCNSSSAHWFPLPQRWTFTRVTTNRTFPPCFPTTLLQTRPFVHLFSSNLSDVKLSASPRDSVELERRFIVPTVISSITPLTEPPITSLSCPPSVSQTYVAAPQVDCGVQLVVVEVDPEALTFALAIAAFPVPTLA